MNEGSNVSENPFAPPRANLGIRQGPKALWDMKFEELRRLYRASVSIGALTFFYVLGALVFIPISAMVLYEGASSIFFIRSPGILNLFSPMIAVGMVGSTVGSFTRGNGARAVGIITCVLMLPLVPFGTALGIAGLVAYADGRQLFGPHGLNHKDVAAVYKQRKKARAVDPA